MKEKYSHILIKNRPELVEEIDSEGGLINHLESRKILSRRQAIGIDRLPDPFKKNEAILDALHRRPDEDFDKFCDALRECNQSHVVNRYLITDSPSISSSLPSDGTGTSASPPMEIVPNGSLLSIRDHVNAIGLQTKRNNVSVQSEETKNLLMNSPQLIELHDIIVKQCESNFYNSKKHEAYEMNQGCRGKCLIINICETVNQDPRQGAEVDERILEKLFKELHFEVVICRNLPAKGIPTLLRDVLNFPHLSRDQCFVLFVMSHGAIETYGGVQSEVIFGSDGKPVPTSEILELMSNCQALVGKPKLAFFQACRGDNYDEPDCMPDSSCLEEEKEEDVTRTDANPPGFVNLPDFIVGFPTQSGFRSFRNTRNGSWYLNAIVRVFMEDAHHMDVSAMLRKVNGIVSQWLPKTTDKAMQSKGQIACITDNLTKPYLYLFPGIINDRNIS